MKTHVFPRLPRLVVPAGVASGLALAALFAAGCARRPIIVQTPAPTVVQNPPATVVQSSPAAVAQPLEPTGRDVIVVKEAPPPPRDEPPPPPPPSSGYTWVSGYWAYRNGHQEWVPGHYERPPRTEATWVPARWERRGDGYVFIEGYWR